MFLFTKSTSLANEERRKNERKEKIVYSKSKSYIGFYIGLYKVYYRIKNKVHIKNLLL